MYVEYETGFNEEVVNTSPFSPYLSDSKTIQLPPLLPRQTPTQTPLSSPRSLKSHNKSLPFHNHTNNQVNLNQPSGENPSPVMQFNNLIPANHKKDTQSRENPLDTDWFDRTACTNEKNEKINSKSSNTNREMNNAEIIEDPIIKNKNGQIPPIRMTVPIKEAPLIQELSPKKEQRQMPLEILQGHEEFWNPLFIMIPSRIGIEKMNRVYVPHIKHILESKFSVGIIGGKPRASLYFIGYQDDQIIYLDPHIVQPSVRHDQNVEPCDIESYHCKVPLKMPILNIDPSLAIGFFFKTKQDFFDFVVWHKQFEDEGHPTIFSIANKSPYYVNNKPQQEDDSHFDVSFVNV